MVAARYVFVAVFVFRSHATSVVRKEIDNNGRLLAVKDEESVESVLQHVQVESARRTRALQSPTGLDQFDVKSVLEGCGSVCDTRPPAHSTEGKYFDFIQKPFDCMALYRNTESDAPASSWPPPERKKIPDSLMLNFSMNNQMAVNDYYFSSEHFSGRTSDIPVWTTKAIDDMIAAAKAGTPACNYKGEGAQILALLNKHAEEIKGKHFCVIGSMSPWLESQLLSVGAAHVTTIEYGALNSKDPRISTMTPDHVRKTFIESNGAQPQCDGVATYSSIEHSGLGRYGDRLNPWGDLQAMAKAWCITKPKGPLFLGVPHGDADKIHWNAHRVYGPKRFPQLAANWLQTDADLPPISADPAEKQSMFAFVRGDGVLP